MYTPDDLRAIAARVHHAEAEAALLWAAEELAREKRLLVVAMERENKKDGELLSQGIEIVRLQAELAAAREERDAARRA